MVSITVREVPAEVRDELAARAARAGQSLEEHVRTLLIEASARSSVGPVVERARRRVAVTGTSVDAATILAARAADR